MLIIAIIAGVLLGGAAGDGFFGAAIGGVLAWLIVRVMRQEAAIASEECAARYGLQLLARDVGDRDDNATVFAILRRGS